jgi:hypothetical protein
MRMSSQGQKGIYRSWSDEALGWPRGLDHAGEAKTSGYRLNRAITKVVTFVYNLIVRNEYLLEG